MKRLEPCNETLSYDTVEDHVDVWVPIGAAGEDMCRRVVNSKVDLVVALFSPLDAALDAHWSDELLQLCGEALARDAAQDDVDGRQL